MWQSGRLFGPDYFTEPVPLSAGFAMIDHFIQPANQLLFLRSIMLIRFLKSYILTRKFLSVLIVLGILFLAFGGNSYAATGDVLGVDKTEVV